MEGKLQVEIEGTAPYIMHKFIEDRETKRGKKTYDPKEECERVVHRDEDGFYFPGRQIKAAMVKQATNFKYQGRRTWKEFINAGIVLPEKIRLTNKEYIVHSEPVVIQRSRVMSWRPKFATWKVKFEIEVLDELLDKNIISEVLTAAGKYNGIGDHRPEYGRFKVIKIG